MLRVSKDHIIEFLVIFKREIGKVCKKIYNFIGKACNFCIENIGKACMSLMEILKRLLRDYPVASCPAISQNIYMYPRAGEVIETAGQLGTCPQKVLATNY